MTGQQYDITPFPIFVASIRPVPVRMLSTHPPCPENQAQENQPIPMEVEK